MNIKELEGENVTSTFAAISAVLLSQDDGLSDHWLWRAFELSLAACSGRYTVLSDCVVMSRFCARKCVVDICGDFGLTSQPG